MKKVMRSRALTRANETPQVIQLINHGDPACPSLTSSQLAGQEALDGILGCPDLREELKIHLESLADDGALFEMAEAIEHAIALEQSEAPKYKIIVSIFRDSKKLELGGNIFVQEVTLTHYPREADQIVFEAHGRRIVADDGGQYRFAVVRQYP